MIHRLWRQGCAKSFDFTSDAILRERVFDLAGDVTIDEAKPIGEQPYQDQGDHARGNHDSRNYRMATGKTS